MSLAPVTDTTEFEVKFYPVDKDTYRKKLTELGAKKTVPERLMRRVLFDRQMNPQIDCTYIRIRDEGNALRLSSKIHAEEGGDIGDQKEIDVTVSDFDKTVAILKQAGLNQSSYQENFREEWELDGATITIDSWPGLASFSEIEALSEEHVKSIARLLAFDWNKRIITSVAEIYMKVYTISQSETLKHLSDITFQNNPFKDLQVAQKL